MSQLHYHMRSQTNEEIVQRTAFIVTVSLTVLLYCLKMNHEKKHKRKDGEISSFFFSVSNLEIDPVLLGRAAIESKVPPSRLGPVRTVFDSKRNAFNIFSR